MRQLYTSGGAGLVESSRGGLKTMTMTVATWIDGTILNNETGGDMSTTELTEQRSSRIVWIDSST